MSAKFNPSMTTCINRAPTSRAPILCESFEEYCYASALPSGAQANLPLITGQPQWPLSALGFDKAVINPFAQPRLKDFEKLWDELSWPERVREVWEAWAKLNSNTGAAPDPAREDTRVIVQASPSGICGAVFAGALGLPLEVAEGDITDAVPRALLTGSRRVVLVTLRDEATDSLLLRLLDEFQAALDSTCTWSDLPLFTLLTGRDLAGLSWLVAKTIYAALNQDAGQESMRLAHFTPDNEGTVIRQRHATSRDVRQRSLITQALLNAEQFASSLIAPAGAITFDSHGFDSCSKGGGGIVLCGLRADGLKLNGDSPGILGCGKGHPCPRGPHPLPLNQLQTRMLMLGTCNGLRLADSVLVPDFNLGLTFLDGAGLGYVSSVFGSLGSDLCSRAFSAALADGRDLAEATAFVNAFLHCAGIERTAYVAIGNPDLALRDGQFKPHAPTPKAWTEMSLPFDVDFGTANLGELLLENPEMVSLASSNCLALNVSSSLAGEQLLWFCRVESDPEAEETSSPNGSYVRVFIFRFPESLGRLNITISDRSRLQSSARKALDGLRRWIEFWRLAGLEQRAADDFSMLCEGERDIKGELANTLACLSFDCAAPILTERQCAFARSLSEIARDIALEDILPSMSGPFWLTNVLTSEYHFDGSNKGTCPNCGGTSIQKRLRHFLHGEARIANICPRCGIVSDVLEGGYIEAVTISAANIVEAGYCMEVNVSIRVRSGEDSLPVVVCPRISSYGSTRINPSPERRVWSSSDAQNAPMRFRFPLPPDHLPHHYFIRVLAACSDEIASGAKVFFVL
jgi:hypothetical protein